MRFEIGSKVALVDDVLKGIITAIHDEMIDIQDDEGMIYRFHQNELMLDQVDQGELSKFSDINHPLLKQKTAENSRKKSLFKKEKNEVVFEVDLHINKLINSTRNLDNFDILTLQLNTAKRKLKYAISNRISKVVFIHGVGEGVLKTELQYLLRKYPVDFYDASFQKYGLGATEVYIFQNAKS